VGGRWVREVGGVDRGWGREGGGEGGRGGGGEEVGGGGTGMGEKLVGVWEGESEGVRGEC